MLPSSLHDFLIASVGASASFIGLLFVALSFAQGGKDNGFIGYRELALADSAYLALLSILFISLAGLTPNGDITWPLEIMGIVGFVHTLRTPQKPGGSHLLPRPMLAVVYSVMAAYGLALIIGLSRQLQMSVFYFVIFMLYGIALGRAWSLSRPSSTKTK